MLTARLPWARMGAVHPTLVRLLVLSLAVSALAWWWPQSSEPQVVEATIAPAGGVLRAAGVNPGVHPGAPTDAIGASMAIAPLPPELPTQNFEPASFDPFVGVPEPPPKPLPAAAKPIAQMPVVAPTPVAPAPPSAPPPAYRYLGRMVDPGGQLRVYLTRSDGLPTAIAPGTRLDDGYVVQTITAEAVGLHYPATDVRAVIAIPAPPPDPAAAAAPLR